MKLSVKQYVELLFLLVDNKSNEEVLVAQKKFVDILIKNNDLKKVNNIIEKFDIFWNAKKNIIKAEVISGQVLTSDIAENLVNYIKKISKASEVNITEKIDKKRVIGGIIIKFNNKIMDASLRTRLDEAKRAFLQ
ncbi:MAG: ATP synthase F1 subunit delta [Candidatus Falkowbacteria bacterium]|nr:ATP synthase F1 subunit delta [Candidatus Falkowbacteria bacterium]